MYFMHEVFGVLFVRFIFISFLLSSGLGRACMVFWTLYIPEPFVRNYLLKHGCLFNSSATLDKQDRARLPFLDANIDIPDHPNSSKRSQQTSSDGERLPKAVP